MRGITIAVKLQEKNDKEHIDSIAQTSNRFREYIVNLLRAEDSEGGFLQG